MLSLIISCTLSRKFQDILDCRRCCYFFFVYDANSNVGNGMAWDVTAETIRYDTKVEFNIWTQKLRISFINLAHVARKNKKKKLKQTNAILADSYVSASNRSVTQLCDLGRERRRSSVEGGAADRLLAECQSVCSDLHDKRQLSVHVRSASTIAFCRHSNAGCRSHTKFFWRYSLRQHLDRLWNSLLSDIR